MLNQAVMMWVHFLKCGVLTSLAWQRNGTPDTLTGTSDLMSIVDLSGLIFNVFLNLSIATGNVNANSRINNDSGSLYAVRRSINAATDTTAGSQSFLSQTSWVMNTQSFELTYLVALSGEEKLAIIFSIFQGAAGAANPPDKNEQVAKYVPSPLTNTIDRFDYVQAGTGDFAADSNLSAFGTD